MIHASERFFKELSKATEGKNFESEEEFQEFTDKFMQEYNANINKERAYDAFDYLEMAENASSSSAAIRYAQKALELDPNCLEADLIIAEAKSRSFKEFQKKLEKLIEKGEKQLSEQGISKEKDAGIFYGMHKTRPYMRVRREYFSVLREQGKISLAISEAEELIRLNTNDNMGIRYTLMALYAYFEDEKRAETLYNDYADDSAFMLLPLIALYYKKGKDKKMKSNIRKLKKKNPNVLEALSLLLDVEAEDKLEEIKYSSGYRPFSEEEVVLAVIDMSFLYRQIPEFIEVLHDEVAKK